MNGLPQIGRYTLLGRFASGGMAELYLARQTGPQGFSKVVVIKRILEHFARDKSFVDMFLNEARLAALINHPNVVSIHELGEDPESGNYYIVMEYIDGPTLKKLAHAAIRTEGALPLGIACRVVADACGALDYAHDLKSSSDGTPLHLVHRDISPENLLVTYTGQVKIVDFGIAKALVNDSLTAVGQVKGKFGYMSPEQVRGQALDRRTDVWALGVTLYWLFTGIKPFRGQNEPELINAILNTEPAPVATLRTELPTELAEIVTKALSKDVAQRYSTAGELQQALEAWMAASGNLVTTSSLATYLNEKFPFDKDPDRRLAHALLSAQADTFTPTDAPVLARPPSGGPTLAGATRLKTAEITRSGIAFGKPQRRNLILASGVALVVVVVAWGIGRAQHRASTEAELQGGPPAPVIAVAAPMRVDPPAQPASSAGEPKAPTAAEVAPAPTPRPPETAHRASHPHPALARKDPGTVSFKIVPWADVYLDGRLIGTTPFEAVQVPPGKHKVRLVNDRLSAESAMTIDVEPGKTKTVSVRLP